MQPVIDFISKYHRMSSEELDKISDIIHCKSYLKNEILVKQGAIFNIVGFINKGAIRTYFIDENGIEHSTGFMFENEFILSTGSFFNQVPSGTNYITLEPTELFYTTHAEFFRFLDQFPHFESVIRKIVSEDKLLESTYARLLRINSSRERYDALMKLNPEIINRVPLKYVASYLGMALETLSRVRAGKL